MVVPICSPYLSTPAGRRPTTPISPEFGEISPDGPAAAAGVREGDVILSLDGAAVTGTDDLIRLLGAGQIGQELTLEVLRDGKVDKVAVRAVERSRQAV